MTSLWTGAAAARPHGGNRGPRRGSGAVCPASPERNVDLSSSWRSNLRL